MHGYNAREIETLAHPRNSMDEARTNAKDRRVSKIPRSRTLAKITQRNRVTSGKENDPPQPTSHAPGLFKKLKQPAQDVHRGSRGGKPPRPTMKHARSLEDLKSSKEQTSITVQSAVQKPGVGVPQAASYQELKRLCHKLSQEQAARCEEVAATEKKMAAVKVHYYAKILVWVLAIYSVAYCGVDFCGACMHSIDVTITTV